MEPECDHPHWVVKGTVALSAKYPPLTFAICTVCGANGFLSYKIITRDEYGRLKKRPRLIRIID